MSRKTMIWVFGTGLTLWLLFIWAGLHPGASRQLPEVDYGTFLSEVESGGIREVGIRSHEIVGRRRDGTSFRTYDPGDRGLVGDLLNNRVSIEAQPPEGSGVLLELMLSWLPFLVLIGVWVWLMRRGMGGGMGGGVLNFSKSRARLHEEGDVRVTLDDVAGCDEAKADVAELVEFLRSPQRFSSLGGRIPRGVLMIGPPGTGKTLLARAIAGEAKAPFFSLSGSDFVEMFVGVGASRVRDLFEQAKKQAPCIVFIDEIDAVGRRRGAGLGGGHDEREQTLNQLLVEMDGFTGNEGVIVIAATNRPDVLDPALLRPGRFDRQVVVALPDIAGREAILAVHMRKVPVAKDVVPRTIARGTPGFSGADLANLVNEAVLLAARADRPLVGMDDFERAKDKIMMGAERRSMVMTEADRRLTAYHEAGHAIVGRLVPDHDPVHKVTIIPRGRALGVTLFLPEQDRYSLSRRQITGQICSLFGGRIAEELIFGKERVTTGAQNDIERATALARSMVTRWGLSERLGPLSYAEESGEIFLGRAVTRHQHISGRTEKAIDEEIRRVIDTHYAQARALLEQSLDKLHAMARALLQYETIDSAQIDDIMAGRPVRETRPPAGPSPRTGGHPGQASGPMPDPPLVGGPLGEH
jgi:cell division protease FtsH